MRLDPGDLNTRTYKVLKDLPQYGFNSFSSLLLYEDIQVFSSPDEEGFIGYLDYSPLYIALGEPVCPRDKYTYLTEHFLTFCRQQNKICIFILVGEEFVSATSHLSWTRILIGDDMIFNVQEYSPSGDKAKKVRSARNQIIRRGAKVKEYRPAISRSPELESEFEAVTSRWLQRHSRFQMYLMKIDLFAFKELKRYFYVEYDGRVIGILTCLPIYARNGYLFEDLIRDPDSPNGATELLILEALRVYKEEGKDIATLGLSPRIVVQRDWGLSWWGCLLTRLCVFSARKLGGLESLYHYRKKFNTRHSEINYLLKHPAGIATKEVVSILKSFNLF